MGQTAAIQKREPGGFLIQPKAALAQLEAIQSVVRDIMKEGEHYGTIPGTPKPSLYKPGAELLNNMYGYRLSDIEVEKVEEWDIIPSEERFPLFRYLIKTKLVDDLGNIIASGIGECNSYEVKYRYRALARKCPGCGKETIIKGKDEYGGGWICFKKKGGCGAKFTDDAPGIIGQKAGRTFNEAIFDQINTLVKMAKKRSYIDATLSATRTSGLFTQDIEDFAHITEIQDAVVIETSSTQSVPVVGGIKAGESAPNKEKLVNHDFVIPFGFLKGKKISEVDINNLKGAIVWAEKNGPEKYAEFIEAAKAYLADDGLGALDQKGITPERATGILDNIERRIESDGAKETIEEAAAKVKAAREADKVGRPTEEQAKNYKVFEAMVRKCESLSGLQIIRNQIQDKLASGTLTADAAQSITNSIDARRELVK